MHLLRRLHRRNFCWPHAHTIFSLMHRSADWSLRKRDGYENGWRWSVRGVLAVGLFVFLGGCLVVGVSTSWAGQGVLLFGVVVSHAVLCSDYLVRWMTRMRIARGRSR